MKNKMTLITIGIVVLILLIITIFFYLSASKNTSQNGPVTIPPQESSISFFGQIIPEKKQIIYPEPYDGGLQMRAVVIPLHDSRYVIANFSWTLFPLTNDVNGTDSVYLFENDIFTKIPSKLELHGNDVRGNILIDGKQDSLNIPESEFVTYDNTKGRSGRDLLRRLPMKGFTIVK